MQDNQDLVRIQASTTGQLQAGLTAISRLFFLYVAAGVDSIEHGSWIDPAIIETFKQQPTWLVPTAYLQDYFLGRPDLPEAAKANRRLNVALMHPMLSRAMQEGVRIAMGTDAGIMPHVDNAKEIIKYVELGMTPMQAIESATRSVRH